MNREEILFERFFGRKDEQILNSSEQSLARLVYGVACGNIHDDDDDSDKDEPDNYSDDEVGDDAVEATMDIFKHINELLKISSEKRNDFLESVRNWLPFRKRNIRWLKGIAGEIQTDKSNSDVARAVGRVVGAAGGIMAGILLSPALAAVNVPQAIAMLVASVVEDGLVLFTTSKDNALLKNDLEVVKSLIRQEESYYAVLDSWFIHIADLKQAIESLIDYDILKEMSDDVQKLLGGRTGPKNMTIGEFKNRFKFVSKLCLRKMCKFSNIREKFDDKVAPVVMTFILVVCLMRNQNRSVLDSVLITQRLEFGLLTNLSTSANAIPTRVVSETISAVGIVINVINEVLPVLEKPNRTNSHLAQPIKEAVEKMKKACLFIENYCYEFNTCKSIAWTCVTQWKSVIIHHVPNDVRQVVIKRAVKAHLPDEAMGYIKLLRLSTNGNDFLVMVPACHSQNLLQQSHIIIRGERCLVTI